jgi:thiol-disulfide isomerase/thioredoxin
MPTRPRTLPLLLPLLSLAMIAATAVPATAQYAAPDWTLPTPAGDTVSLHDKLADGPVVVSFWATWCIPCLKEMPHLNEMAGDLAGQATFIAVSVDNSKSMAKVGPLVRARGWDDLVVVQDAAGTVQQTLQVLSPPYTVVYDAAGNEVYRHEGYKAGDEVELKHAVEQAIASVSPTVAAGAPAGGYGAPDWTLPTPDGGTVGLHDQLDQGPVVVSFWATWCIPCLKEMPHLNEMAGRYAGRASFIAVSVDNSKSMAKVGPLVRAKGWDDLLVAQDAAGTVQQTLQVLSPPYTIVYDRAGNEVYRHEGYKAGDEVELEHALEQALAAPVAAPATGSAPGGRSWQEAVTATDQFEYSYSLEDDAEIAENWLDVAYQFGGFRTGIMVNHQAPAEDGNRRNQVMHRYAEFDAGRFALRAGHFYGMFGRGLVWNSYEDRFIRVDTALDGLYGKGTFGGVTLQAMTGTTGTTPTFNDPDGLVVNAVDVRGADVEVRLAPGLSVGLASLTYLPDLLPVSQELHREWVGTGRLSYSHPLASLYVEHGTKTGYEYDVTSLDADAGHAFYGNLGVYAGPLSVSLEHSDYERFKVLEGADGKQPLNRPPALVREHIYTLLGRKPHAMNQDDETGWQVEANLDLGHGLAALGNASRIETQAGEILFEEIYGHVEKEHLGDLRLRGGFGYQEGEGTLRQTVVADATWYMSDAMTWTAQIEHQHVRAGVLGAYDQQWMKLELELPPRWTIDAIVETNNKFEAQFEPEELRGDFFPSGQISYALTGGGNLNLWFGKRQAGQLCAGGVCKFEPAFEGVEFYGIFRY